MQEQRRPSGNTLYKWPLNNTHLTISDVISVSSTQLWTPSSYGVARWNAHTSVYWGFWNRCIHHHIVRWASEWRCQRQRQAQTLHQRIHRQKSGSRRVYSCLNRVAQSNRCNNCFYFVSLRIDHTLCVGFMDWWEIFSAGRCGIELWLGNIQCERGSEPNRLVGGEYLSIKYTMFSSRHCW